MNKSKARKCYKLIIKKFKPIAIYKQVLTSKNDLKVINQNNSTVANITHRKIHLKLMWYLYFQHLITLSTQIPLPSRIFFSFPFYHSLFAITLNLQGPANNY